MSVWVKVSDLKNNPKKPVEFKWKGFSGRIHKCRFKATYDEIYKAWRADGFWLCPAMKPYKIKLTNKQREKLT